MPGVRSGDITAALCGRYAGVRSAHDRARHFGLYAADPRAGRELSVDVSARRRSSRARRRGSRNYLLRFRHFRGAGSKTSQPQREGRYGTNFISIGGRDCALGGIDRARKAGFSALVVTIDTPVAGFRERDLRNGAKELLSGKLGPMLPFVNQLLVRPRWLAALLADGGLMKFENVVIPGNGPMLYADVTAALEQSVVTWDDLKWIRQAWNAPIVIKGIHTAEDARRAVDMGADALVVSNHGGRQLDGVAPTLRLLPEVVAAVGDRIEVLLDGGIRRGSDIVKARCLGARAVMAGRAYAYGLGAAGGAGVSRAIEILRADLVRTLKLLGCASVAELDGTYVNVPREWLAK